MENWIKNDYQKWYEQYLELMRQLAEQERVRWLKHAERIRKLDEERARHLAEGLNYESFEQ